MSRKHIHGDPVEVPGVDLPPPYPARGSWAYVYNPGPIPGKGTVKFATWSRADGSRSEFRSYSYNGGPVPPKNTIATVTRIVYDVDGTTIKDTFTHTFSYTVVPPIQVSSEAVT